MAYGSACTSLDMPGITIFRGMLSGPGRARPRATLRRMEMSGRAWQVLRSLGRNTESGSGERPRHTADHLPYGAGVSCKDSNLSLENRAKSRSAVSSAVTRCSAQTAAI